MKKFLVTLTALLAIAGYSFADTATPDTEGGTVGVDIGTVWEIDVDGYAAYEGDPSITTDNDLDSMGENMYFGTIGMGVADIYSTIETDAEYPTDIDEYTDVAHRAGNRYMDVRVFVSNNQEPHFRVDLTVTSPLLDQTIVVPPSDNGFGGASESTMHVTTGTIETVESSFTTNLETNLNYRAVVAGNPIAAADKGKLVNGAALTVYRDATASVMSDIFVCWVALDFLPVQLGATPRLQSGDATDPATWSTGGTCLWSLIAEA